MPVCSLSPQLFKGLPLPSSLPDSGNYYYLYRKPQGPCTQEITVLLWQTESPGHILPLRPNIDDNKNRLDMPLLHYHCFSSLLLTSPILQPLPPDTPLWSYHSLFLVHLRNKFWTPTQIHSIWCPPPCTFNTQPGPAPRISSLAPLLPTSSSPLHPLLAPTFLVSPLSWFPAPPTPIFAFSSTQRLHPCLLLPYFLPSAYKLFPRLSFTFEHQYGNLWDWADSLCPGLLEFSPFSESLEAASRQEVKEAAAPF